MGDEEAAEPAEREDPDHHDEDDQAPLDARRPAWPVSPAMRATFDALMRSWTANFTSPVPPAMTSSFDAITRSLAAKYASAVQFTYPVTPSMAAAFDAITQSWSAALAKLIIPLDTFQALRPLFEELLDRLPPNWRELSTAGHRLAAVVELAKDGFPVCWVPRAEVIAALDAASPDERLDVLAKHREDILDDCAAVLAETTADELVDLADAAGEAVAVLRQGQYRSAQALASSVVDTALRLAIPPESARYYPHVLEKIRQSRGRKIRELRRSATFWPVIDALQPYWAHNGDPVPDSYNRHASAHAVGNIQYTEPNALIAVMLATSMLRELQEEYGEQADEDQGG